MARSNHESRARASSRCAARDFTAFRTRKIMPHAALLRHVPIELFVISAMRHRGLQRAQQDESKLYVESVARCSWMFVCDERQLFESIVLYPWRSRRFRVRALGS
jgi:hypothetical protein